MPRREFKYFLKREHLDSLRKDILPFLSYDRYMADREKKEYTVRSIYLDSPDLTAYGEKLAGIRDRHKYRIRGYNTLTTDSVVFLEIKRKEVDQVSKDRAPLRYGDIERFLDTKDYSLLADSMEASRTRSSARNFVYYYLCHKLAPVSLITYEREAFECKFGTGLRITFDKNIRTRASRSFSDLQDEERMISTFRDRIVLEIKFNRIIPAWLPSVMKKYNVTQDAISKYSGSIDVSHNNINKFLF